MRHDSGTRCHKLPSSGVFGGVREVIMNDSEEAIEETLVRLYPSLRRFAAVVAPPEVAPDDLVHDAVVALLRLAPETRLDDVAAYLRRSMVNLASNHRRRLGRARRATDRLSAGVSSGAIDQYPSDLGHLASLHPEARAVLYMQHVEGLPLQAIADELDLGYVAVRQISVRARRTLRRHIEQQENR